MVHNGGAAGGGDKNFYDEQWSILTATLYGILSFTVVLAIALLLLLACKKKYTLNWFEKNLLEAAKAQEMGQSEETLISGAGASAKTGDDFWLPPTILPRSTSTVIPAHEASASLAIDPIPSTSTMQDDTDSITSCPKTPQSSCGSEKGYRSRLSSMQARLDHTKIDTTLYQKIDGKDKKGVSVGTIHLSLIYDPPAGILTVRLLEAQDLQSKDFSNTADPYAKIRLLPDRNNVWQTRVHKKTLNPVFDEDFVFEVSANNLCKRALEILLYDFDAYSRHQCIGSLHLNLSQLQMSPKVTVWKPLLPHNSKDGKVELGDLMVSLSFLPSAERLTIVILKARNLRIVDDSRSTSDPYVRVTLISLNNNNNGGGSNKSKSRKKRTSVQKGTVNPTFNEAITFDVSREVLSRSYLEFTVISDEEILGLSRIGPNNTSEDHAAFFREMLTSRTSTARWLPLDEPY